MEKHLEKSLTKIENNPEIIYDELENFFSVSYVEIWKYDSQKKTAFSLKDTSLTTVLHHGKTHQSIIKKSSIFSNHVVSSKAYIQSEDNPINYKIKSILITPLEVNEQIVGFIRLFVSVKKRKNFTRQDVQNLELWKKTVLHFLGTTQDSKQQKQFNDEEKQILKTEISSLQKELNNFKALYQEEKKRKNDPTEILSLQKECQDYQILLKEKNEVNRVQNNRNKHLEEKVKKIEKEYLFLKNTQSSQKQISKVDKSIKLDPFLKKIYINYPHHTYLMSLAEILYFIKIDANLPPPSINETLEKSESILTLLEFCDFEETSFKERHILEDFLVDLKYFLSDMLQTTKLKISTTKETPPSLFFNLKIAQSILLRFIAHVSQDIDNTKDLEIKLFYTEKTLNIEMLFTKIKNKNKFNIFSTKKNSLYNSTQLIHNINQKMLTSINGNIQILDEKNIYKFLLTLPAYIIKL